MAGTQINRVSNANAYVNGNTMLGKIKELQLPSVVAKMIEHQALGQQGAIDLPSGFEKMEGKIIWSGLYPEVLKEFANIYKAIEMQVRFPVEVWAGGKLQETIAGKIFLTFTSKGIPLGNYKPNELVEAETDINVLYVREEINGEVVVEMDPVANIYRINGEDLLSDYRSIIGQ